MNEKPRAEKSAGAVIYYFDEETCLPVFLFLQNTLKTTYWEFPKGKIEENENIEETVIREVQEETGLEKCEIIPGFKNIIAWYFRFNGELIRKEAVYLLIRVDKKEKENVKICKEHQKFRWMTCSEVGKEVRIKANREMALNAVNFIKDFERQKKLSTF